MQGETMVAVTSGANMNFDRLRLVTELADLGANVGFAPSPDPACYLQKRCHDCIEPSPSCWQALVRASSFSGTKSPFSFRH